MASGGEDDLTSGHSLLDGGDLAIVISQAINHFDSGGKSYVSRDVTQKNRVQSSGLNPEPKNRTPNFAAAKPQKQQLC